MIKAIIFDYDGVIVDSFSTVFEVYKLICEKFGVKYPDSLKKFKEIYGYNAKEAKRNLGISPDKYEIADQIFGKEILKKEPKIFEGMKEVLVRLSKKYQLFLITSNFKKEAIQKARRFGISKYFVAIMGDESKGKFLKREAIRRVIMRYKFEKEEVLYVGDRDIDYDIGCEAGVKSILVNYGWGYNKKKIKQKIVIKNPKDIFRAIEGIE